MKWKERSSLPQRVLKLMMITKHNCNTQTETAGMHVRTYTDVLADQLESKNTDIVPKEVKTSNMVLCCWYLTGCKSTLLISCFRQLIPIANIHDEACLVCLFGFQKWHHGFEEWGRHSPCLWGGDGACFKGLWLGQCNADEDFTQSVVFMMPEHRRCPFILSR